MCVAHRGKRQAARARQLRLMSASRLDGPRTTVLERRHSKSEPRDGTLPNVEVSLRERVDERRKEVRHLKTQPRKASARVRMAPVEPLPGQLGELCGSDRVARLRFQDVC